MKYHAYVIAVLNEWQLFDRKFVDAVLNEWQKTMMDLPAGFRQAYEMVNIMLIVLLFYPSIRILRVNTESKCNNAFRVWSAQLKW